MGSTSTATATDGRDNDKLAELRASVKEAVAFAEEWPEAYRPQAFDLAVEQLLATVAGAATPTPGTPPAPVTLIATGGLSAVAREIGVESRLLTRVVEIGDEGKVSILGRIDSRTKAELQLKYSATSERRPSGSWTRPLRTCARSARRTGATMGATSPPTSARRI